MKLLLTILALKFTLLAYTQESKVYFDDAISEHLESYNLQSQKAIANSNLEYAEFLFDSLLNHHLKHTYIPNLKLYKVSGEVVETDSLKRPFLLITKNSWNLQDTNEIQAINHMAELYQNQIDIIVLYWNTKKKVKPLEKQYNKLVHITYSDETENRSSHFIKTYKHSFGVPTCFFISSTKQLVDLNKKFELFQEITKPKTRGMTSTYRNLAILLFKDEMSKKGSISTLDEETSN